MLSLTSLITAAVGFIQSLLFSCLLLSKKQKQFSDWILLLWFSFFALHLFLLFNLGGASKTHLLLAKSIGLLHGPFFFLYTRSVLNLRVTFKDLVHFGPFMMFLSIGFFLSESFNKVFEIFLVAAKLLSLITYSILVRFWLAKRLSVLKRERADNFYLESRWINTIAVLLLIYSALITLHFSGDLFFGFRFSSFLDIALYAAIVTIIGFYGLKFKVVYDAEPPNLSSPKESEKGQKYKNSPLKRREMLAIRKKINTYFENSDEYLNSDFNLSQLSQHLAIKKHHLSEVINLEMGTTFYDIVNAKRIQYAIQRMQETNSANITLEGLGYECGFNTKSAFYRHFKQITGKTPGKYYAEISPD